MEEIKIEWKSVDDKVAIGTVNINSFPVFNIEVSPFFSKVSEMKLPTPSQQVLSIVELMSSMYFAGYNRKKNLYFDLVNNKGGYIKENGNREKP